MLKSFLETTYYLLKILYNANFNISDIDRYRDNKKSKYFSMRNYVFIR